MVISLAILSFWNQYLISLRASFLIDFIQIYKNKEI